MIPRSEFEQLYLDAGLDRHSVGEFLGRKPRQVKNWLRYGAPEWTARMLRMRAGWLDEFGWKGWRIRDGQLWCLDWPYGFEPGELYAWWWLRQKGMRYYSEKCSNCPLAMGGKQMKE